MNGIVKAALTIVIMVVFVVAAIPMFSIGQSVNGDPIDVVIIDGQSNAAYINDPSSVNIPLCNSTLGTPDSNLYYFGDSAPSMWDDDVSGMALHKIYTGGEYVIGGLVAPLAYYVSEKTGRDVLIIDVGIGAQMIQNLIPGTEKGDWKVNVINAALNQIKDRSVNMLGWLWLQGEANKSIRINAYESYFMTLKTYYDSIGCHACFIVEMSQERGGNSCLAQKDLIEKNAAIVSGADTSQWDGDSDLIIGLHYTQLGRIIIAEDVVSVMNVDVPPSLDAEIKDLISVIPLILIAAIIVAAVVIMRKQL